MTRRGTWTPVRVLVLLMLLPLVWVPLHGALPGDLEGAAARESKTDMRLVDTWSVGPKGEQIAVAWRGDLWIASLKTGHARRLTTHAGVERFPQISPDGTQVAFVSNRSGPDHVYVMPIDGGPPTQVTTYTGGFILYGWFPDGTSLLVRTRKAHHWRRPDRFFRRTLDPLDPLELLFDAYGGSPAISPDGKQLAFVREGRAWWRKGYHGPAAGQIWRYDREQKSFHKLTTGEHGERWPQWSADGKRLYFSSQEKARSFNLWEMDTNGGSRKQITRYKDDSVVTPRISADGKTLVFRRLFDLYQQDLAGTGKPTRVALHHTRAPILEPRVRKTLTTATQVAFSDDAREIAFVAGGDIWVMDTELREPRRVTNTPAEERDPVFSADYETLSFVSDAAGQPDVYQAKRADPEQWWWQNDEFAIKRLTNDPGAEKGLQRVPGSARLAFVHGVGNLVTMAPDGTDRALLLEHWDEPSFDFSPDGKWLAWSAQDNDFNSDVWIKPVDGHQAPINVSLHPDHDFEPRWSPDGKRLAWIGRRWEDETDVYYVWLQQADDETRKRDRTLEKAVKKMKGREVPAQAEPQDPADPASAPAAPERPSPDAEDSTGLTGSFSGHLKGLPPLPPQGLPFSLTVRKVARGLVADLRVQGQFDATEVPLKLDEASGVISFEATSPLGPLSAEAKHRGSEITGTWKIEGVMEGTFTLTREAAPAAKTDDATPPAKPTAAKQKGRNAPKLPTVEIDIDRLTERIHRLSIPNAEEADLLWSADGKQLTFWSRIADKSGRYSVTFPDELKPKLLTTTRGTGGRWLTEGNQIAWLAGGRPATLSHRGKATTYAFRARHEVDQMARNAAAFLAAWRTMRDVFYDERMGNRDWSAIRTKYADMASACATGAELELVINLMLGELNASHLGFRSTERRWTPSGWAGCHRRPGMPLRCVARRLRSSRRTGGPRDTGRRGKDAHLGRRVDYGDRRPPGKRGHESRSTPHWRSLANRRRQRGGQGRCGAHAADAACLARRRATPALRPLASGSACQGGCADQREAGLSPRPWHELAQLSKVRGGALQSRTWQGRAAHRRSGERRWL